MRSIAARPGWILVTMLVVPFGPFYRRRAALASADGIAHDADAADLGFETVAALHELGRRARESDPLGRPGGDDVARVESLARGKVGDEARQLEVHMLRVRLLLGHSVYAAGDIERARIERIGRHDPRTHRAAPVEALALVPLAPMAALQVAPRDVVHHRVAPDM